MLERLLHPRQIPESLWSSARSLLQLPRSLADAYVAEIDRLGLREQAKRPPGKDGPTGGISQKETFDHFAERFTGSCGRLELAILDPKDELENASDLIVRAFAGGKVALLDVPCGAGAATATLLTAIAQLRQENRLPCLPLEVNVLGGDLSEHALQISERLIDSLRPNLEQQSIRVYTNWTLWNALDADDTTRLLNKWITDTIDYGLHFLVLANFSGFLFKEKQFKKANPQLQEMVRWTSCRPSSIVLWVEPPTRSAGEFFRSTVRKFVDSLKWMGLWRSANASDEPHATTNCVMAHAFETNGQLRTGVHLIVLKRTAP